MFLSFINNSFLSGYDLNFLPHLQSPDFSSQSDAIQVNNLFGIVCEITFSQVRMLLGFRLFCYLTTNFIFCYQNAFSLLSFSILNFFRDCVIDKQSFGGKIFGFQSLKWPHNG